VVDVAVFARADEQWGEAVVAKVVRRDGTAVSPTDLQRHCAERLAPFKVPKLIEFDRRLPRTELGKLLRPEL
jgi:acyl-CoA synthetase (AMP-forming)/AMP-acid ligase II